jgi:hypothetical protein
VWFTLKLITTFFDGPPLNHTKTNSTNALRMAVSAAFMLAAALAFGQQGSSPSAPAKPIEASALCRTESLPAEVQSRLEGEFSSWKVQESTSLSPFARKRWEDEKPPACPGIAVGKFENDNALS